MFSSYTEGEKKRSKEATIHARKERKPMDVYFVLNINDDMRDKHLRFDL